MNTYKFQIDKCNSNHKNMVATDWYNRKCLNAAIGRDIIKNHDYDVNDFFDPIDCERIAKLSELGIDFEYTPIGNVELTANEVLAASFNVSIDSVIEIDKILFLRLIK